VVGKKCFQHRIKRAAFLLNSTRSKTRAVLPPRNDHGLKFGNKKAKKAALKSRAKDDDTLNTGTKT